VRALGTSFVVRRDPDFLAVTLVEGAVTVAPQESRDQSFVSRMPPLGAGNERLQDPKSAVTLRPGQKLTYASKAAPVLAETSVESAVAWRWGQVVLDDTPLDEAAAEMNRYSRVQLVVEDPAAKRLLVNGLFQAGDSISFARALGSTYGLRVLEQDRRIVLEGMPSRIEGRRTNP
jgi:transmembrane sensor